MNNQFDFAKFSITSWNLTRNSRLIIAKVHRPHNLYTIDHH